MEIAEIIKSLNLYGLAGIIVVAMTIVQVTPVQINPWSKLAKSIGRALNAEVIDKISENETDNVRYRIIRFDDEIRHHVRHTEEHFNQIIGDIDKYEDYCKKHPQYENNKAKLAIENIKKTYSKCRDENTFFV